MTGESENSPIEKKDRSHIPPLHASGTQSVSPHSALSRKGTVIASNIIKKRPKCDSGRIEFRNHHNLNAETSLAPVPPLGVVSRDLKSFRQYLPCRLGKNPEIDQGRISEQRRRSWRVEISVKEKSALLFTWWCCQFSYESTEESGGSAFALWQAFAWFGKIYGSAHHRHCQFAAPTKFERYLKSSRKEVVWEGEILPASWKPVVVTSPGDKLAVMRDVMSKAHWRG